MTRLEVQHKLAGVIGSYRGPIVFHAADCVAAVIAAFRALKLDDLCPSGWGRPDAVRALRKNGNDLARAIDHVVIASGWVPSEPAEPEILDLGVCRLGGSECLAVHNGVTWLARGPQGPALIAVAAASWRAPASALMGLIDGY